MISCLSWRKFCVMKKQEAEYDPSVQYKIRVQGNDKCDIRANLNQRFIDRDCSPECPMRLYGDNKEQYTLLKMTCSMRELKHIEVDCHIVRKKLEGKIIVVKHISSEHHLANHLTKSLGRTRVDFICDKLIMYDIYAPA